MPGSTDNGRGEDDEALLHDIARELRDRFRAVLNEPLPADIEELLKRLQTESDIEGRSDPND